MLILIFIFGIISLSHTNSNGYFKDPWFMPTTVVLFLLTYKEALI